MLLRKKSVDQIIAPITKIVSALDKHEEKNLNDADHHNNMASEHVASAQAAISEAAKAAAARAKIAALIS